MDTGHGIRYDKWAKSYNKDVIEGRQYDGLKLIVDFLIELSDKQLIPFSPQTPDMKILDVGCGTGLVGERLAKRGFSHIDGVDLSLKMVEEAYKTGVYKSLMGWCDIQQELPFFYHNQFDLVISCGVFTVDMVRPQSLAYLIQCAKPGGIILLSTRTLWYDTYDFESFYKKMIQLGHIKLLDSKMDAPYLVGEFDAHYWAFSVIK